MARSDTDKNIS